MKFINGILGVAFAGLVLFQTGHIVSKESTAYMMSVEEAKIVAEIDAMFAEEENILDEDFILEELEAELESEDKIKIFNSDNELLAEGSADHYKVKALINQADLLSEVGSTKYYRIAQ